MAMSETIPRTRKGPYRCRPRDIHEWYPYVSRDFVNNAARDGLLGPRANASKKVRLYCEYDLHLCGRAAAYMRGAGMRRKKAFDEAGEDLADEQGVLGGLESFVEESHKIAGHNAQ